MKYALKKSTIDINGLSAIKIVPKEITQNQPILFVHGMCCGAWIWQNFMEVFANAGYICYALNLRGHFGSGNVRDFEKVRRGLS